MGTNDGETINVSATQLFGSGCTYKVDSALSTFSGTVTLASIDTAIQNVSDARANFGAVQNRLEHTLNNLSNYEENLTSSESNIRDVDMASEMVTFTKLQVLQHAGAGQPAAAERAHPAAVEDPRRRRDDGRRAALGRPFVVGRKLVGMGFFRRTPELLSRQRDEFEGTRRQRSFAGAGSLALLVIAAAGLVAVRFGWLSGLSKPEKIAAVALVAAIILLGPLFRRKASPRQPISDEVATMMRRHMTSPESGLPKELLDAGFPEEMIERLRQAGPPAKGTTRSFSWSATSVNGGPLHTEFHETTPDGQTRHGSYDGSVKGGVWRLVKATLRRVFGI